MSKKHKKFVVLNYIDYLLITISTSNGCVSISAFASLVRIRIGIASSTIGLKICVIGAGIRKYKLIINKKRKKYEKVVLLVKYKLNNIEDLISKALIDSNISHDEFVLIHNMLKEFYYMNEELKNSNDK